MQVDIFFPHHTLKKFVISVIIGNCDFTGIKLIAYRPSDPIAPPKATEI
jgi:hypothetical protein